MKHIVMFDPSDPFHAFPRHSGITVPLCLNGHSDETTRVVPGAEGGLTWTDGEPDCPDCKKIAAGIAARFGRPSVVAAYDFLLGEMGQWIADTRAAITQ